ncbi:protein of unknown function [Paraburkholderia kururiensis]
MTTEATRPSGEGAAGGATGPLAHDPISHAESQAESQAEKARRLRALHEAPGAFVIPNPWDIGSARLLAATGFKALATSSAGYAFSRGVPDSAVGREQMLVHLAEIAAATDLPVSADLENGFGDAPETAAQTIRLAAGAGVWWAARSKTPPAVPTIPSIRSNWPWSVCVRPWRRRVHCRFRSP